MFPAGTYECGFNTGSVRHTARTNLTVALLPDDIILQINPLSVDCSDNVNEKMVKVTATVLKSKEDFDVQWRYNGEKKTSLRTECKTNLHYVSVSVLPSFLQSAAAQNSNTN